jgi:hypothetical protein
MGKNIVNALTLSNEMLGRLTAETERLESQGVKVSSAHSGELNFAGCASGYCQAWD